MNQMPSGPFVGPFTVADTGFHRTIELKVICPSQWVINYPRQSYVANAGFVFDGNF